MVSNNSKQSETLRAAVRHVKASIPAIMKVPLCGDWGRSLDTWEMYQPVRSELKHGRKQQEMPRWRQDFSASGDQRPLTQRLTELLRQAAMV